ncbi:MAG: GAF domain-containing protein [Chloroflexi bacterium]|nr:GAF domain-containing protein [Chloroflexota bacterium]
MSVNLDLQDHDNAVFIVQPGGRIRYINDQARTIFDVWDVTPNIERLARKVRPGNTLLSLCATEGEAQLMVTGQTMDAASYFIPNGSGKHVLVSLRPQQLNILGSSKSGVSNQTIEILTALNQAMAADLELETTLQAILDSVDRLIPTDFAEITIWEPETKQLVPYRFVGVQGIDRHLETTGERYPLGEGYSGAVAASKAVLLIEDVDRHHAVRPLIDRQKYPFHSYLGLPLLMGGELIGTLDLTSLDRSAFREEDVELLQLLSGQAAIALHNALLYREEKRRSLELSSLAQLTQAISSVRDSKELFARLSQGIASLLDVEIAGFLLFDEAHRRLVAQLPFVGVPPEFVALYQAEIPPDSPGDRVWRKQELLVFSDTSEDENMIALGLAHLARPTGMKHAVLVPLKSGGRSLGYLQVANKKDGGNFTLDDERLLAILAGQAAPIVENADLVQQSIQRALRAESLRRIASLSGSEADLNETLKYSVLELSRLLKADAAAIFFLDENLGALRVHAESIYGVDPKLHEQLGKIPVSQTFAQYIVTHSQQAFITNDTLEDRRIVPPYRLMIETLETRSAIDVPLIFRGRGVGEIVLASRHPDHFTRSDIQLTMTVAGQLGVAIERDALTHQTDANLRQRVDQLTALTRIGRELNSSADPDHILKRVYEEAISAIQADCGTILLFKDSAQTSAEPEVRAYLGDAPGKELHPLEKMVLQQSQPVLVSDYQNPPEALDEASIRPPHQGVHSALIVPIAYQGEILGIIHLHATQPDRFDEDAVQIAQALAAQAAVAIGNAQRHHKQQHSNRQMHQRLKALKSISDASKVMHEKNPLEKPLYEIAAGIREITTCPAVVIGVYQSENQLQWITGAGISPDALKQLRELPLDQQSIESTFQAKDLLLTSYFIAPAEEETTPPWMDLLMNLGDPAQPGSVIFLPLVTAPLKPLGVIAVCSLPRDEYPERLILEILSDFAIEASYIILQYEWTQRLEGQITTLESRLTESRTSAVKILENQLLAQSKQNSNAVLEIIELVARQPDRASVLDAVGQGLISKLGLEAVLVVEMQADTPQLIETFGKQPKNIRIDALLGQRNPLVQSIHAGDIYLIEDIAAHETWQNSPLLQALNAVSFLCFPVLAQAGASVAFLAVSPAPIMAYSADDEKLFGLLARQISTALNNLALLVDTSQRLREVYLLLEFSRQLGGLEPQRVAHLLVESTIEVVKPAQAGMVLLFNEEQHTLKPAAAYGYAKPDLLMAIDFFERDTLAHQVFSEGKSTRVSEVNFSQHYRLEQTDLLRYREAVGEKLPVSAMALPIQSGESIFGVLLIDNFQDAAAFSLDDQMMVSSIVRQSALTLENIRLYRAAEQRATQLHALSNVSAKISTQLEYHTLIEALLETLEELVPYDTGTLWIREKNQLTIRAARGFAESNELLGVQTSIEDSLLFAEMIQTASPLYVADIREDERFSTMPANRLSWLAIPMLSKGDVLGVFALEKSELDFFKSDHIQILITFANQAAVALENADLYRQSLERTTELDQRSQRLAVINRFSQQISSSLDLDHLLEITCRELDQSLPSSVVSGLVYREGELSLHYEEPTQVTEMPLLLPSAPITAYLEQSLGVFNTVDVYQEELLKPLVAFFEVRNTISLLILPLATGEDLHGFIFVHSNQRYRFTADEIELTRILSNQSAVAIENAGLFIQTRKLTAELEQRVEERTQQLAAEHDRTQALLRIMRELAASLDLDHVLNQTLILLNEVSGAEQSTILLVRPGEATFYYRASLGYTTPPPLGGRPTNLAVKDGLAGWIIRNRDGMLIDDLHNDARWKSDDATAQLDHRSAMGVPLLVGTELLGVMLLFHRSPGHFDADQIDLAQAAANQIAVAINNAELFNLIREQAERLGNMLRTQQVETSRSRAILEAVADGVLVTDSDGKITLFNDSAQQVLGLSRDDVISKSLESFSGLFGNAAQMWFNTISGWSDQPLSAERSSSYTQQITLEDGRFVAVNLAPVHLENEFLGTVSIFRDITHQVVVDRLKSEFVATVSHELRTPMTSIKGYIEIMLMGAAGPLSEQQTQFLEVVLSNTQRLNILVNDLLDVSRIEAGKIDLSLQPVRLQELVTTVVADQRQHAEEQGKPLTFTVDIPDNLPKVFGDAERVRQILTNLLNNAYHYTPTEGHIDVKLHKLDSEVQIDIHDTGIGILPEDQERVFERFYRGEDPLVLATAGTGLGLSIVRQLVEMHKGRIWLQSSGIPGEGSIFSMTLPIYREDEHSTFATASPKPEK